MNFLEYKDAQEFLKKNHMTPEEGLRVLDEELEKLIKK